MRPVGPCAAFLTVALLLTLTPVLATDEPGTGVTDKPAPLARPRMVGLPDGDSASGLPIDGARVAEVRVHDAAAVGGDLAYVGNRRGRGAALHWIDGVTGQERRLASANMGEGIPQVEALGHGVVFNGSSRRAGVEPWFSDGTRTGTRMLKDIARGRAPNICTSSRACGTRAADSRIRPFVTRFVTVGGIAYFPAHERKHGDELWRTDGTEAGTWLVKDIRPGEQGGLLPGWEAFTTMDDELYFVANDGRHGAELWRSDGTRAGTRMVRDIGPGRSVPWGAPVAAGDYVYFVAQDHESGRELWRSDGTAKGTVLVRDIVPGPSRSKPMQLTTVEDALYFTAVDRDHGRELWRTDGTAEGTALVRDIAPGEPDSFVDRFTAFGADMYFAVWEGPADLTISGTQYRTDGTEAGTQPFGPEEDRDATLSWPGGGPSSTLSAGGRLYFVADDGAHGFELWSTDGTPEGTALVDDLRSGPKGSNPQWLVASNGYLYFTADDGSHGRQWWQLPIVDS